MNCLVAIASFALVILVASADDNVEKRGLMDWIFVSKKSVDKMIRECMNDEIPLPLRACSLYADGPHGCDGFCRMKAAIPDIRDCAFVKAQEDNATLTEADFQLEFDAAIDLVFNKRNHCGQIQLPEPSKTILQATQEAYTFCLKQNAPFLGKVFFQFFTLPRLCNKENGADTKTGEWLIRCLRANTVTAINGAGAAEQIAEVRTRFGKDNAAKIFEKACKALDELKQMDRQQMKAWFTSKAEQIKQMVKTGKWNVVAGKEVEPTEEQKKKAEEAAKTLVSEVDQGMVKRSNDAFIDFLRICLGIVAAIVAFQLLFPLLFATSVVVGGPSLFLPFILIVGSLVLY